MDVMYHYFVSYMFRKDTVSGFSNMELISPRPVETIQFIEQVQETIRTSQGVDVAKIINFQLLRKEKRTTPVDRPQYDTPETKRPVSLMN